MEFKMDYYGNNDWRDYIRRQNELKHFGIPKRSGRYPWGSGEDPYHHGSDAPSGRRKKKLQDFTLADNRRVGRARMRYGMVGGLASMHNIKKEGYNPPSKESKYTEVEQDRLARASNSLGGLTARYIAGLPGQWAVENLEKKKIERDKKLLGDDYKKYSEYTEDQLQKMNEAHEAGDGKREYKEWINAIKENAKALKEARKEAKSEQKVAPKEKQVERFGDFTGKQWDASNVVDKYYNNVESLSEADYKKLRDTAKEIRNKGERATNAELALEKHANTILENRIANELKRAKEKDNYDFNFIEAIQNKQILEDGHETERLKAYEEYLRDPEDFWKNKLDKYKDT